MIKLPKLNEQTMFDFETNYHLTMNEERLGKFLAHYESNEDSTKYTRRDC